ncbi:MAG: DUF3488 and transglutaminase-like domain-containing protein [Neisseria sp.]|nr:DUF3488 and transglutaminase-like domain-containing protein [Neisseria sp.]
MMILNPPFLRQQPPRHVQAAVLLALLWAALPLVTALPLVVTALFGGLWLLRMALLRLGIGKVPLPALLLMAVMAAALVWQQLGTLVGREGGIAFLLLLVMLKAFEGHSARDWQVLLLAMLFLIGSSVVLNQSLPVGGWLLLALLAVALCFALLCGLAAKEALWRGGQALLLTLPLMVVLFVSVPRLNEPLWRIPQPDEAQAQTGLSDSMEPGSISNLVQSNEWVANVTFADGYRPQQGDLYWRAIIMGEFDGTRWRAVDETYVDAARVNADAAQTVAYQMILRDQQGVIPALDYPAEALPQGLEKRLGQVVRARASREGLRRVALQADLGGLLPHRLSEAEKQFYTALPAGNLQTRQLAESLARRSAGARQFVDQVLHHYRSQSFAYTLQPPRMPGNNGIDEFMFRARRGFCEHYAQSFVVMMRAAGLPARVVTGYLGAEYNAEGGFWQIRSRDAHAWAEVWLADEEAWLRVDPTSAAASQRSSGGIGAALSEDERSRVAGGSSRFSRWREAGQFYWQQWVVNYDQSRQQSFFAALGLGGFNWKTALLVLPAALLLALLPLLRWWLGGRRREQDDLQAGFMLLKTALMGEGDETVAATSAAELRQLMQAGGMPEDAVLNRLLDEYEHWLYAAKRPSVRLQRRWYRQARKLARRYYRRR